MEKNRAGGKDTGTQQTSGHTESGTQIFQGLSPSAATPATLQSLLKLE